MGTLKEINFEYISNEAAEGVSYLNAIVNNVNLISLETLTVNENPSFFE